MKSISAIILITLISGSDIFSQNTKIDSLRTFLKTAKQDTNKVNTLNALSWELINKGEYEKAMQYVNDALSLSNSLPGVYPDKGGGKGRGWAKGIAASYNNIGNIYKNQGNYPDALKNYFASLKIREELGNKKGIAASYNNIGNIYTNQGNYSDALKNHFASLKIKEEIGDKGGIADSYNNIGNIYYNQGNYPDALKNCFASLKIRKEIGDKDGIAASYNNIGIIYMDQGNYPDALKNHFASLKIQEEIGDKGGIATSYINLGSIKLTMANITQSSPSTSSGQAFNKEELHIQAKKYLDDALFLSKEIGNKEHIKESYSGLAALDSAQGNAALATGLYQLGAAYFGKSLEHYKMYIIYRDSIDNEETRKKTIQTSMTYEFEQKEAAAKAEQDKKDAVGVAENKKRQLFLWFIMALGLAVVVIAGIIFRSLQITKKQKQVIESQKQKVEIQNEEITKQKHLVEEKNRDISDSVSYAQRIQSSFLTSETYIKRHLSEYFILYKPRDVVSGDFYWMHQKGDYIYFCVADCTGHGIPGAFMSLIGMGILNEIIYSKQIKDTNQILDELRRIVIAALNPEGALEEGKDGMDLILVRLNLKTKELQYSAANNSFYVYRKGELMKYTPDKMPVGKYWDFEKPFTQHTVQLKNGDIIYASTDGFRDQFGGEQGKKYMSKRFEEYISSISDKSLDEQKEMLEKEFMEWKGNIEQVDDVCVIGLRL